MTIEIKHSKVDFKTMILSYKGFFVFLFKIRKLLIIPVCIIILSGVYGYYGPTITKGNVWGVLQFLNFFIIWGVIALAILTFLIPFAARVISPLIISVIEGVRLVLIYI